MKTEHCKTCKKWLILTFAVISAFLWTLWFKNVALVFFWFFWSGGVRFGVLFVFWLFFFFRGWGWGGCWWFVVLWVFFFKCMFYRTFFLTKTDLVPNNDCNITQERFRQGWAAALYDLEHFIQLIKRFLWVAANFPGKYQPNVNPGHVRHCTHFWPQTECGLGTSHLNVIPLQTEGCSQRSAAPQHPLPHPSAWGHLTAEHLAAVLDSSV